MTAQKGLELDRKNQLCW